MTSLNAPQLQDAWKVFTLFAIPIGGGIPAGVLLASQKAITWPFMMLLYFLSDVALACVFEPLLRLFIAAGRRIAFLARMAEAFRRTVQLSTAHFGDHKGPIALILIAFGVDPMTGRAAAIAAGHGFVSGWMIAIAGDMIYFALIMVSTLWLKDILGDGTTTMLIILAAMFLLPILVRRIRGTRPT